MVNLRRCVINYVNSVGGFTAAEDGFDFVKIVGRFGAVVSLHVPEDPRLSKAEEIASELDMSLSELLTYGEKAEVES